MSGFRHEIKYNINYFDFISLKVKLACLMKHDRNADENGIYTVTSLYFDNYKDKALKEKIFGIGDREKFRIRIYNGKGNFIRLEKKQKKNNMCKKLSAIITADMFNKILEGDVDFLLYEQDTLLREFYVKYKTQCLRPKTIVSYKREAFLYSPGNVRITFDFDIRTGLYETDILKDNVLAPVKDPSAVVLEVKYDEFLPSCIGDCLQIGTPRHTAFSKYAQARAFEL